MRARVPQDVDLEDKLIYGLSPARLGYVVTSLLAAFALWSSDWAADAVRLPTAVLTFAVGAILAWGRWRERPLDGWAGDIATYICRNFAITYQPGWYRKANRQTRVAKQTPKVSSPHGSGRLFVFGCGAGDGETTVAVELACLLASRGERTLLVDGGEALLRLGLASPGRHPTTGLELRSRGSGWWGEPADRFRWQVVVGHPREPDLAEHPRLLVTRGPGGRVCRLVQSGSESLVTIPEDPTIEAAQVIREPAVMFDPAAPACRAVGVIADLLNAPQ